MNATASRRERPPMQLVMFLLSMSSLLASSPRPLGLISTPSAVVGVRLGQGGGSDWVGLVGGGRSGGLVSCFMVQLYEDQDRNGRHDQGEPSQTQSAYHPSGLSSLGVLFEGIDLKPTSGRLRFSLSLTLQGGATETSSGSF